MDTLAAKVSSIEDDDLRAQWQTLSSLLSKEVSLLSELRDAVASGDYQAEQDVLDRLLDLQRERADFIREVMGDNGTNTGL